VHKKHTNWIEAEIKTANQQAVPTGKKRAHLASAAAENEPVHKRPRLASCVFCTECRLLYFLQLAQTTPNLVAQNNCMACSMKNNMKVLLFYLFAPSITIIPPTDTPQVAYSPSVQHPGDGSYIIYHPPPMLDTSPKPSAIFTAPLLAQAGLRIHTELNIVICVSCGIAWKPSKLIGHLKNHHIQMKKADEEKLMSLIHSHGITNDTETENPIPKLAPVELLTVHQGGYCCNICDYCCRSSRSFDNHWSSTHHNFTAERSKRFHRGDVQTIFDPVPVRFFEVSTCLQQVPIGSPFDIYMKKELPNHPSFQPTIPLKEREIPPFLHVTQWHMHLEEYVTNDLRRKALRDIVRLPKKLQKDDLHTVVINYMQSVTEKASKMAYQLRCLLIECPRCALSTT
jgi:Orsellinic acid/F9775 biosynthesis cluster protein D